MPNKPQYWTEETITAALRELAVDGYAPTTTRLHKVNPGLLAAIYKYTPGFLYAVKASGLKCKKGRAWGSKNVKGCTVLPPRLDPTRPCDCPVLTPYALELIQAKDQSDRLYTRLNRQTS